VFRLANRLDSGAYYIALAIEKEPSEKNWLKAGNAYFEAFRFAISVDAQRADSYGEKARDFYKKILDKNPENYLAKANMAMTYTVTPNPMQGIGLLREILAKDENNQLALLNLGLLSMQSGQHDKAIQRFEKLLEVNPQHIEAQYYLGQSYMNKGDKAKARELFTAISQAKADSLAPYRASASDYLKELKAP
jgi:tetratricopeptide (TPR) repeat protein